MLALSSSPPRKSRKSRKSLPFLAGLISSFLAPSFRLRVRAFRSLRAFTHFFPSRPSSSPSSAQLQQSRVHSLAFARVFACVRCPKLSPFVPLFFLSCSGIHQSLINSFFLSVTILFFSRTFSFFFSLAGEKRRWFFPPLITGELVFLNIAWIRRMAQRPKVD